MLDALDKDSGNTTYEKLECLGLEHQGNSDRLVATFHLDKTSGYSGGPCTAGSTEYVAFWADWDDDCKFEYLGTVETNVHDYASCRTAACVTPPSCRSISAAAPDL